MTNRDLFIALRGIDERFISEAVPGKKAGAKAKRWVKWIIAAACLAAAVLTAAVIVPMITVDRPPEAPTGTNSDYTFGKSVMIGAFGTNSDADYMSKGFEIRTVVEAEVMEVLPDSYYLPEDSPTFPEIYLPSANPQYHIARLRIIDSIRGENLPDEIYLRYPHYGTDLFDGYDSLILSMEQIGVENYMMLNETRERAEFFPNMFRTYIVEDVGYGSVIAFRDGAVDESLWDRANRFESRGSIAYALDNPESYRYPAGHGSTPDEVKENILTLAKDLEDDRPYDYVTADELFVAEDSRQLRAYLEPSESNVFMQSIFLNGGRVIGEYTRVVNGFTTDESYLINGLTGPYGNIISNNVSYDSEDLSHMPDIGAALAQMDLSELKPSHITLSEDNEFRGCHAVGFYRKAGDKVYGILRIAWCYSSAGGLFSYDDCYYLYEPDGNGKVVERDELRTVIGNDPMILRFDYNSYIGWDA